MTPSIPVDGQRVLCWAACVAGAVCLVWVVGGIAGTAIDGVLVVPPLAFPSDGPSTVSHLALAIMVQILV